MRYLFLRVWVAISLTAIPVWAQGPKIRLDLSHGPYPGYDFNPPSELSGFASAMKAAGYELVPSASALSENELEDTDILVLSFFWNYGRNGDYTEHEADLIERFVRDNCGGLIIFSERENDGMAFALEPVTRRFGISMPTLSYLKESDLVPRGAKTGPWFSVVGPGDIRVSSLGILSLASEASPELVINGRTVAASAMGGRVAVLGSGDFLVNNYFSAGAEKFLLGLFQQVQRSRVCLKPVIAD